MPFVRREGLSLEQRTEVQFMLSVAYGNLGRSSEYKREFYKNLDRLKEKGKKEEAGKRFGEFFLIDSLLKRDGENPEELYRKMCGKLQ